jgi:hypothetical protein
MAMHPHGIVPFHALLWSEKVRLEKKIQIREDKWDWAVRLMQKSETMEESQTGEDKWDWAVRLMQKSQTMEESQTGETSETGQSYWCRKVRPWKKVRLENKCQIGKKVRLGTHARNMHLISFHACNYVTIRARKLYPCTQHLPTLVSSTIACNFYART